MPELTIFGNSRHFQVVSASFYIYSMVDKRL